MADHLRDATKKMDFIRRDAAKQTLTALLIETALNNTGFKTDASKVYEDIAKNRLDTWINLVPVVADLRPVVRGKWTRVDYEPCGHDYICSECGCKSDGPWNFCHDCGADMRGESDG